MESSIPITPPTSPLKNEYQSEARKLNTFQMNYCQTATNLPCSNNQRFLESLFLMDGISKWDVIYNLPLMPKSCASTSHGQNELLVLIQLFSTVQERSLNLDGLTAEIYPILPLFCVHMANCFCKSHIEEFETSIGLIIESLGPLSTNAFMRMYDSNDPNSRFLFHFNIEIRYFLLGLVKWTSHLSYSWKFPVTESYGELLEKLNFINTVPLDEIVLLFLCDSFFLTSDESFHSCQCLGEYQAVLLYHLATREVATNLFFNWMKANYTGTHVAKFVGFIADSFDIIFNTLNFPEIAGMKQFNQNCLRILSEVSFVRSSSSSCLASALKSAENVMIHLGYMDDLWLRSTWDFFASNLNNFRLPVRVQNIVTGLSSVDLFEYLKNGNKTENIEELNNPLLSFVYLFLSTFTSENISSAEKRKLWRKLKGALFKRFYEANLRRLDDDGWLNAILLLSAVCVAALDHSNEDLTLVGEIIVRSPFVEISTNAQISLINCLFSMLNLGLSWSTEFHPARCVNECLTRALTSKNRSTMKRSVQIYLSNVESLLNKASDGGYFDEDIAKLVNVSELPRFLAFQLDTISVDDAFVSKTIDSIIAILISSRQLLQAVSDSQNDEMETEYKAVSVLISSVDNIFYPTATCLGNFLSKNDANFEGFIELMRGFLLLAIDISCLHQHYFTFISAKSIVDDVLKDKSPKISIAFLADCFQNSRIDSSLKELEVTNENFCLTVFFKLNLQLLLGSSLPNATVYEKFRENCYNIANLGEVVPSNSSDTLTMSVVLENLTNFIERIGLRAELAISSSIFEPFLATTEELFKQPFENQSNQSLVKMLFSLAGSLMGHCSHLLYKPFRPDCFMNKLIMMYFYRVINALKNIPPTYVFSSLYKWVLPGLFIGVGKLLVKFGEENSLKRLIADCVTETMNTKMKGRPNYTSQNIDAHPLISSNILGGKKSSSSLALLDGGCDDFKAVQRLTLMKMTENCILPTFPQWQLAISLLTYHIVNTDWNNSSNFDLASTFSIILPRILDAWNRFEENRNSLDQNYQDAMANLFEKIGVALNNSNLWSNSSVLRTIGDYVDKTATAYPKLTFVVLDFFLRRAKPNAISEILMAIRTAVVRMELDYGNGDLVRPHFENFQLHFSN